MTVVFMTVSPSLHLSDISFIALIKRAEYEGVIFKAGFCCVRLQLLMYNVPVSIEARSLHELMEYLKMCCFVGFLF